MIIIMKEKIGGLPQPCGLFFLNEKYLESPEIARKFV
jgi:hypothetical protein